MDFLNRIKLPALAGILVVVALVSCEQELTTIGAEVIGGEPFNSGKVQYDVFAFNKKISAVRTNQLPVYQLGTFNDPIYGKTEASITAQFRLSSANPVFGLRSQADENRGPNASNLTRIPENEVIDSVYLYIPFLINPSGDADGDGVPDEFDGDPLDPNNDDDGDGLTNNEERIRGTDPLNPDTDGDGVLDAVDTDFIANQFPKKVDLDSIYGPLNEPFELKVERSTFFLRELDPSTNFREAQEYFSNQQFSPTFIDRSLLFEEEISINVAIENRQIPLRRRDDIATADVDESTQFSFVNPGIRVALDHDFFQQNLIDKEGSSELLSQANFTEFLRGLHLSIASSEHYLLFDLRQASIVVSYTYDSVNTNGTANDPSDDEIVKRQSDFTLSFLTFNTNTNTFIGNAVNTLTNSGFPTEIAEKMDIAENASKLYLKGGAGSYAEVNLFDMVNGREIINEMKANNWIINEASLIFHIDTETVNGVGAIIPPRLYLYNAETNRPLIDPRVDAASQMSTFASYPLYGGFLDDSDTQDLKYVVRITNHINNMVLRDAANATLGLTITPDIRFTGAINAIVANDVEKDLPDTSNITPLGTVIFGSNEIPGKEGMKLQLQISYTQAN